MSALLDAARLMDVFVDIIKTCNEGTPIAFERDLGGNSLLVRIGDRHTHIGIPEDNEDALSTLILNLRDLFLGGPHLSLE